MAEKYASAIIIISVIGLITIPLFPWFGIEDERHHNETDEEITVVNYQLGNSRYLHLYADMPYGGSAFEDLDGDISMISLCFWVSLLLGIIAIAGVAIYRTGRSDSIAHTLLLIGAFVIVFSILALAYHYFFIGHLDDLENEMNQGWSPDEDNRVIFGYNIFPLIMSIFLLIISVFYLIRIAPYSKGALSWITRRPRYGPPPMYPQYRQPPQYPQQPNQQAIAQLSTTTRVPCSNCKNMINIQATTFPVQVKCSVCGTTGLVE